MHSLLQKPKLHRHLFFQGRMMQRLWVILVLVEPGHRLIAIQALPGISLEAMRNVVRQLLRLASRQQLV